MDIIDFLSNDGFIIVNKKIAKEIGLNESILLGELCSEYRYWRSQGKLEEGWFFSTVENVEENTTLSAYQQRKSLKALEDLNFVRVRLKGTPPVRHISINVGNLNNQMLSNFTFKSEKSEHLNVKKVDINSNNKDINNNNNNITQVNESAISSSNSDDKNIVKGSSKSIRDIITTIYRNDLLDEEVKQLLVKYYTTVKRGFTVDQVIMQIKTLQDLTNNVKNDMICSINNSIERGYSGFYFNKQNKSSTTSTTSAETIFNQMSLGDAKEFQHRQTKNAKEKGWIF